VVDGADATTLSITQAASLAGPGDFIRIIGMTDPATGKPVGYTESNFFGNAGEVFPITIADGISVYTTGSPVYVYSAIPSGTTALFTLAANTGSNQTRIAGITFLGGQIAIDADADGSSGAIVKDILLQDLTFHNNGTGVSAVCANDVTLSFVADDCRITGAMPVLANPPGILAMDIGFRFQANGNGSTGLPKVTASINSLVTAGPFTGLGGASAGADVDIPFGSGLSRVIEVHAQGDSPEIDAQSQLNPIPEVILNINGGTLHGGPATNGSGGWDFGVYSSVTSTTSGGLSYHAGTTVNLNGVVVDSFRKAGIYAVGGRLSRGLINLRGQAIVRNTGTGLQHDSSKYPIHNGVHLFSIEGYLGLSSADSTSEDNAGNGVFLSCPGTQQAESITEYGLYLAMKRTQLHGNGDSGLEMYSGVPTELSPFSQGSIVGGTWSRDTSQGGAGDPILAQGDPAASLPFGQGVVDQCAISNNDLWGIHVRVQGETDFRMAFCRFVNTIIWNNLEEGLRGDISLAQGSNNPHGTMLTPMVQCTLAGNGDNSLASLEFADPGVLPNIGYAYSNPGSATPDFATEIDNTILQRKNPADSDLGPNLDVVRGLGTTSSGLLGATVIGLGGLRFQESSLFGHKTVSGLPVSTKSTTPFSISSPSWTSRTAAQFFLDAAGTNITDFKDKTPTYINATAPEVMHDFSGSTRTDPLALGKYDKGAEELP